MEKEQIRRDIHEVILKTFQSMVTPASDNTAVTNDGLIRIKYPYKYKADHSHTEIRISEQELKQVFIYYLQTMTDYWYSVETPTTNRYRFKDVEVPEVNPHNQSALVDLSIYPNKNEDKPYAHIEFKCGNPEPMAFQKDILKLYREDIEVGFFVQILPADDNGTWKNLYEKKFLLNIEKLASEEHEVAVYILSLSKSKNCFICKDLKTATSFVPKPLSECK